jgi:hypothetical protein
MKLYTIIYAAQAAYQSAMCKVPKFDRVQTNNLKDLLSQEKYYGKVFFVFEGWPELEGEFDIKPKKP